MDVRSVGKFIATLRKERGLTQKQLADELFVNVKTISKWEICRGYPDVEKFPEIAVFFSITIDELMSGKRNEPLAKDKINQECDYKKINLDQEIQIKKFTKEIEKKNVFIAVILILIITVMIVTAITISAVMLNDNNNENNENNENNDIIAAEIVIEVINPNTNEIVDESGCVVMNYDDFDDNVGNFEIKLRINKTDRYLSDNSFQSNDMMQHIVIKCVDSLGVNAYPSTEGVYDITVIFNKKNDENSTYDSRYEEDEISFTLQIVDPNHVVVEEIEFDVEKSVTIMPNEKVYLVFNSGDEISAFNFAMSSEADISVIISKNDIQHDIFWLEGTDVYSSVITNGGIYFFEISNPSETEQYVSILISEVENIEVGDVKNLEIMHYGTYKYTSPYTLNVMFKIDHDKHMVVELYDENYDLIDHTLTSDELYVYGKLIAGKSYFLVIKNHSLTSENVELSVVWESNNIKEGHNFRNRVVEGDILTYSSDELYGEFNVTSDSAVIIYDKNHDLIDKNSNGSYTFLNKQNYYFVMQEAVQSCEIIIEVNYTENLVGDFNDLGVQYIKYVPESTGNYNVIGINKYKWYSENFNLRYGDLNANEVYYLMIEDQPNVKYSIFVDLIEKERTQIPLMMGVERQTGQYYFIVQQEGIYTFKTYRNTDSVNSTISIYGDDGTEYCNNVSTDFVMYEIKLSVGTYYLDLETNPDTESVMIRIMEK